jgi:hypothetical protein
MNILEGKQFPLWLFCINACIFYLEQIVIDWLPRLCTIYSIHQSYTWLSIAYSQIK